MKIYNTMTGKKETLNPINGNSVKIYACGPTVYNLIHLGNARQICVFDTLRRYLKYRGFDVFYVQNFTDIDDKIIKKANESGLTSKEVSENAIKEYFIDAHGLGIIDADIHPKVTDNMDIIIDIIKRLIAKDFAYMVNGDVYFRTKNFNEYGKLSHMPLDELEEGSSSRVGENELKENPMDFALWKAAKLDEPYWDSPFGKGRPGWHIECSALSRHYIGETIDIHGGGADLIFPHHENEIAQSEAAFNSPLANIWMHNGMLNVDNRKMAKSQNNFFLVRDVAQKYNYPVIRFMLLSAHYRSQLNYSLEVMESSLNGMQRLNNCKDSLARAMNNSDKGQVDPQCVKIANTRRLQFQEAMDDDLNTADGIAAIFELVRDINTIIANGGGNADSLKLLDDVFTELSSVIGIEFQNKSEEIPQEIVELVEARKKARAEKNFSLADEIRSKINILGYTVEETRQGTIIKKSIENLSE